MAVVTTKSASITALDATPVVEVTTGEGAGGMAKHINDFVTGVVGDSIASIYRIVRIPTDCKIKKVEWTLITGSTAGAADIDIFFSDSLTDGTPPSLATLADPVVKLTGPADNKFFGSAQAMTAPVLHADKTFSGTAFPYLLSHVNLPIWQVLVNLGATQFTADPGGFFDLGLKLTTALTVTAGQTGLDVYYVD